MEYKSALDRVKGNQEIISRLGSAFQDVEDQLNFKIVDIVEDTSGELFFKYFDTDKYKKAPKSDRNFEYTPSAEVLTENTWVKWAEETAAEKEVKEAVALIKKRKNTTPASASANS